MFDKPHPGAEAAPAARHVDATVVRGWTGALGETPSGLDDAGRVDLIRALEDLKSAAAATQARVSVALDGSQRAAQRAAGMPAKRLGIGVGTQVALARRESPYAGGRHLGLAHALVHEMPHTLVALASGVLSEWRATVLARESACLSREDRTAFDKEVCGDPRALVGLGTRALTARARAVALRLDATSVVARARRAESERCVTIRPAPDTMTYLTALLPVAQGVAAYAALTRAADSARAAGDPRGRGQVMADEVVARIVATTSPGAAGDVGMSASRAAGGPARPAGDTPEGSVDRTVADRPATRLEVQLVMTDRALLAGDDEPASIPGYGTVPGPWARDLVLEALESARGAPNSAASGVEPGSLGPLGSVPVWVRRLFTAPTTGQLVAMDSRARAAPVGLADLIRARDAGACRTPYCDAPMRHVDHVDPWADGGATEATNLQAKCEACNYTKQAPGWREAPAHGPAVAPDVTTTTPSGHRYVSRAPTLPGGGRRSGAVSPASGRRRARGAAARAPPRRGEARRGDTRAVTRRSRGRR